jgi:hypothetical protein
MQRVGFSEAWLTLRRCRSRRTVSDRTSYMAAFRSASLTPVRVIGALGTSALVLRLFDVWTM